MNTDLVFEKQELDALIHQAVRKYAPLFIRRKIALQYEDVHCQILTDEKWLEFVLEQVLSNALKYTRKGKIKIYMDPQSPKTLVIEDTGIGIAPEDLPRVFERVYRLQRSHGQTIHRYRSVPVQTDHGPAFPHDPDRIGDGCGNAGVSWARYGGIIRGSGRKAFFRYALAIK